MDILDVSNLVNYFGKVENIEKIELSPVLLQKGDVKLALYGLGSCRDERLHRMFRRGNVKFLRPNEDARGWFNILVLHQNRWVGREVSDEMCVMIGSVGGREREEVCGGSMYRWV